MEKAALPEFLDIVQHSFEANQLVKLSISKNTDKNSTLKNIYIRPVEVKNKLMLSFLYRYSTQDIVKNLSLENATDTLKGLLGNDFLEANLLATQGDYKLMFNKKRKARLLSKAPSLQSAPSVQHDKEKNHLIKAEDNLYLKALGITGKDGKVLSNSQKKFRQINKYIEIIDNLLKTHDLLDAPSILDMGSGKGYLTFALYDYLKNQRSKAAKITGIELRPKLVEYCNNLAEELHFKDLQFVAMDINDYPAEKIDMLIALHACDTATDVAIAKGIQSDASAIIVAPCCHKQVRKNMNPTGLSGKLLKHGILMERQAELITDSIRSLILEANGYQTKVFEFISTNHTPKNLMIVATRGRSNPDAHTTIEAIKDHYGLEYHFLEKLLE